MNKKITTTMRKLNIILLTLSMGFSFMAHARENVGPNGFRVTQEAAVASACVPATSKRDLDFNNVKALIMNGGDMWWDQGLGLPRYEVPKGSGKHSQFAASLWIGGIDAGGQLKIAAQTYRQNGNDFWPGALDIQSASITDVGCTAYDKHFLMYRDSVSRFLEWRNDPTSLPGYQIPAIILNWPGNGDAARNEDQFLAPFIDSNGDGVYDPLAGDYPGYDLTSQSTPGGCTGFIYGDQTLFWVFNDKGNIHTETQGQAIGLEVRGQAFSFATNDEINNMTFYSYQVINRSTFTLNDTYFANWSDPDLGDYSDDFVGCDVPTGLGFCYNGDEDDGTGQGNSYGKNPPASGVDFFQGPLLDADNTDNPATETISGTGYGDGVIDNERLGMEIFMVFKNDQTLEGNPSNATHFYNYMRAKWKDGLNLTFGGNGRDQANPQTKFAFPWVSDPNNPTDWEANEAKDWRFVHSAGPFTLKPGAVNYVTVGAVWAKANSGGPKASVDLLKEADIKAQALFDNCFKVLNGPDAPDLDVRELNREVIIYLSNAKRSNNYLERYEEVDPLIGGLGVDNTYNFQGYLVYQIKDATVAQTDLGDISKARVVAQCDKRDGVGALINHYFDATLNANLPVLENPTNGEYDKGVRHSFRITEDAFATGQDKRLVNHKTYFYMAVAYGYNNFKTYNPLDPNSLDGQKRPLLRGRLNVKVTSAIPNIPAWANGGTTLQSVYGMGPKLTRVEGQGNGGNVLELTDETIEQILGSSDNRVISPEYKNGNGPVDIKVIDPLNVPEADFEIRFLANISRRESIDSARWVINQISSTGEILKSVSSDTSLLVENEQLILDWGLSVRATQVNDPGKNPTEDQNGFIEGSFEFADITRPWLNGIPDIDGQFPLNWIRSGTTTFPDPLPGPPNFQGNDYLGVDDNQYYEGINFGTIAPYRLVSNEVYGPAWSKQQQLNNINNLASVDLVITSDKSKWTRSAVLELQDDSLLAEGRAKKLNLRKAPSVDKDGKPDGTGSGMGWFPGYAINLETGERLNISFGENSWLVGENGRDMIWNPTPTLFSEFSAPQGFNEPLFGGMHYVYIFGHNGNTKNDCPRYDNGAWMSAKLDSVAKAPGSTGDVDKRNVYKDAMWVFSPLLNPGFKMLENDVKFRIRVRKPYEMAYASNPFLTTPGNPFDPSAPVSSAPVNQNNPTYRFSTRDLAALKNNAAVAKSALDLIKAVPNPYYAYSEYERSNLENVVKITNLPEVCTVKIYSINGTLIRAYDKDDPKTSLNWDLKNHKNIPIASGLYVIHVNVPNVGEKVIKWFGAIRPIDVDQF